MLHIMHEESRQPEPIWQAQEVVREIDRRPHLLVRVAVRGGSFPHRAMGPFLRIVEGDHVAYPWFTEVAGDSGALFGYFATDLPRAGTIEYGYPGEAPRTVRARFSAEAVERLERGRLPGDVVEVTRKFLDDKRRQQEEGVPR